MNTQTTMKEFLLENKYVDRIRKRTKKNENEEIVQYFKRDDKGSFIGERAKNTITSSFQFGNERITTNSRSVIRCSNKLDNQILINNISTFKREIADFDKNMVTDLKWAINGILQDITIEECKDGFIVVQKAVGDMRYDKLIKRYYFEDFGNAKVFTDEYDKVHPRYEIYYMKHLKNLSIRIYKDKKTYIVDLNNNEFTVYNTDALVYYNISNYKFENTFDDIDTYCENIINTLLKDLDSGLLEVESTIEASKQAFYKDNDGEYTINHEGDKITCVILRNGDERTIFRNISITFDKLKEAFNLEFKEDK